MTTPSVAPAPQRNTVWILRARIILGLVTAAILILTTFPTHDPAPGACLGGMACGERGLSDVLMNIMLFVPLGWALRRSRLPRSNALLFLAPIALSAAIELMQTAIPGRHPNPSDVLFNSVGAWIGAFVLIPVAHAFAARRGSTWATAAWTATMFLIFGATAGLLQTTFPVNSVYFGQWTPTLGGKKPYTGGAVVSAEVDGVAMPSFALANTRAVRLGLERGAPLSVRFVVAPEPPGLSPIFAVADRDQIGIMLFGTVPGRLILTLRTRADALRLNAPNHEIATPVSIAQGAGDTITVTVRWPAGVGTVTFAVDGVDIGQSRWTLARGWAVLYHGVSWNPWFKRILDMVWIGALFLPLGYFGRATPASLMAVAAAATGAVVIGMAGGLAVLSVGTWLAATIGIGTGARWPRRPIRAAPA